MKTVVIVGFLALILYNLGAGLAGIASGVVQPHGMQS